MHVAAGRRRSQKVSDTVTPTHQVPFDPLSRPRPEAVEYPAICPLTPLSSPLPSALPGFCRWRTPTPAERVPTPPFWVHPDKHLEGREPPLTALCAHGRRRAGKAIYRPQKPIQLLTWDLASGQPHQWHRRQSRKRRPRRPLALRLFRALSQHRPACHWSANRRGR
jgi:hypothetical protein